MDQSGEPERIPGKCKSVKAIGWFIEEYDIAQISMNLTDIKATPLNVAFEECCISATNRGLRVTGSELVGVLPKAVLLEAGRYFLKKQNRSIGVSESELIHIAVKSLGLDDLAPFDPRKKIMEYLLDDGSNSELVSKSLVGFADQTASESPAPGGGSVSAYVGSLGISLGAMVANLSAHKTGWDDKVEYFSEMAHNAQMLKETLLKLVDQDTFAFNKIIEAIRLPKNSDYEKSIRNEAINSATKHAIDIPFQIMQVSVKSMEILKEMAKFGNPNSVSDAAVGALCARTAVQGGFLNVQINCLDFKEQDYVDEILNKANVIMSQAFNLEKETLDIVNKILEK